MAEVFAGVETIYNLRRQGYADRSMDNIPACPSATRNLLRKMSYVRQSLTVRGICIVTTNGLRCWVVYGSCDFNERRNSSGHPSFISAWKSR